MGIQDIKDATLIWSIPERQIETSVVRADQRWMDRPTKNITHS